MSALATSILLVSMLACSGGRDSSAKPGGTGPDLSGVADLNQFNEALRLYTGPYRIETEGFFGTRVTVTRHFDGTAFSFKWSAPSPVEETRLFSDGGDPGPVCYTLIQGDWVQGSTSVSPRDPTKTLAGLISDELLTGPGVLEPVATGFEYRGASRAIAPDDARIEIDVEVGRIEEMRLFRGTTLVRTDRFSYSPDPRIERPQQAADGIDVQC